MSTAVVFVESPPGLAPLVDFTLDDVEGAPGLHTLSSSEHPEIRLFVVDAPVYLPWYEPHFGSDAFSSVGAADQEHTDVLVVTTLSDGAPIVNLMAPMLVNRETGAAAQVILDDDRWPLRAELLPV
ncbi:flagellar assembly protein FliW [Galbitalea soli]|uniref:Flagellar assembly protein FliW n=1 Tax=Galbitalea soli TaxID=1268042 RepID=A0A7C9TQU9_9MICO|nr:flagellar assembly protein FliW [Galbitalea soli]NYJ29850.1 flagellar assembly factor FliW [Galbitalea soli]